MAHYAIGDIQGCYREFRLLLAQIGFNCGSDTLWLVGDIVNRGPQSLETLQFVMRHTDCIQTVLGNHDLHLLALMYGSGSQKKGDTLSPILKHSDHKKMRDWLRAQPLMLHTEQHVLVHAGLLPEWTVAQAQELADEVGGHLKSRKAADYFAKMYGNTPDRYLEGLKGSDRRRFTTNVMTRMRTLNHDGSLNYAFKSTYADIPPDQCAWFDAPERRHLSHTVIFGHWSALGYRREKNIWALDTGALWGNCLTAVDIHSGAVFSQAAEAA